uniref:Wiskott-Aldrich syndrome protein family member n=1 Tax=Meloidogyne javanica TaxID=6303 RepID=A0A915LHY5_MELJA
MPLTTRSVSPVNLSLHRLPDSVRQDELQCITNGTFANLIRQLSSLSRHAQQIFSDIHREVLKIDHRTNTLFLRVERLAQKVAQQSQNSLDQTNLEEAALRKAFKSCNIIDQHSLSRQTLPTSLQEQYQQCDPPPELNELNPYREDEKEALRYYTDPGYFFELWRQEILKECGTSGEKRRTGRSPTSPHRRNRDQKQQKLHNISQQQQNALLNFHSSRSTNYSRYLPPGNSGKNLAGKNQRTGRLPSSATEVLHFPAEYQAPQALLAEREMMSSTSTPMQPPPGMTMMMNYGSNNNSGGQNICDGFDGVNNNKKNNFVENNSQGLFRNVSNTTATDYSGQQGSDFNKIDGLTRNLNLSTSQNNENIRKEIAFLDDEDDELPPPPPQNMLGSSQKDVVVVFRPPPILENSMENSLSENNFIEKNDQEFPSPPPQPNIAANQFQYLPAGGTEISTTTTTTPSEENKNINQAVSNDNRSLLLIQIQEGVQLKKVQKQEEQAEKRAVNDSTDVAAILRKRMEHCFGGSSDESSSNSPTGDDNEWD